MLTSTTQLSCPPRAAPSSHQHDADQVKALVRHACLLAGAVHKPQPLWRRPRRPLQGALALQEGAHGQHVRGQVDACRR